jgi:hypothetical protein
MGTIVPDKKSSYIVFLLLLRDVDSDTFKNKMNSSKESVKRRRF